MEGKIIRLTPEQVRDTMGINIVDCEKFKFTFYKYMPWDRLHDMLSRKEMAFVNPSLWNDPYEVKYLNTDYSILGYSQPKIFCFCVRNDNENEEASWKIYKTNEPDNPLIRISIKALPFLKSLKESAINLGYAIYMAKVSYRFKQKEINELYKRGNKYFNEYFENFNEEKYIRLLSIKRKAFKYEQEIRLFLVPQQKAIVPDENLLRIGVDISSFIRFTYEPLQRKSNNERDDEYKQIVGRYKEQKESIRKQLRCFDSNFKLYRSTLYDDVEKVKIVM